MTRRGLRLAMGVALADGARKTRPGRDRGAPAGWSEESNLQEAFPGIGTRAGRG